MITLYRTIDNASIMPSFVCLTYIYCIILVTLNAIEHSHEHLDHTQFRGQLLHGITSLITHFRTSSVFTQGEILDTISIREVI